MRLKVKRNYRAFVEGRFLPRAFRQVREAGAGANRIYVPKPYPGTLTLLRATEQPYGIYPDRNNGWSGLALGGIEVHDIPGHHGSIMREPRVRILAKTLGACLEKAHEREFAKASRANAVAP
jgi:thioesterase domain-containing protein